MPTVRSLYLALALHAFGIPSFGENPAARETGGRDLPRLSASIHERTQFHRTFAALNEACPGERRSRACTEVVRHVVECKCEQLEDGWGIAAVVEIEMTIHLVRRNEQAHERLHLNDIRQMLPRALSWALKRRFDDEDACAKFAALISNPRYLSGVLTDITLASMKRLH